MVHAFLDKAKKSHFKFCELLDIQIQAGQFVEVAVKGEVEVDEEHDDEEYEYELKDIDALETAPSDDDERQEDDSTAPDQGIYLFAERVRRAIL